MIQKIEETEDLTILFDIFIKTNWAKLAFNMA